VAAFRRGRRRATAGSLSRCLLDKRAGLVCSLCLAVPLLCGGSCIAVAGTGERCRAGVRGAPRCAAAAVSALFCPACYLSSLFLSHACCRLGWASAFMPVTDDVTVVSRYQHEGFCWRYGGYHASAVDKRGSMHARLIAGWGMGNEKRAATQRALVALSSCSFLGVSCGVNRGRRRVTARENGLTSAYPLYTIFFLGWRDISRRSTSLSLIRCATSLLLHHTTRAGLKEAFVERYGRVGTYLASHARCCLHSDLEPDLAAAHAGAAPLPPCTSLCRNSTSLCARVHKTCAFHIPGYIMRGAAAKFCHPRRAAYHFRPRCGVRGGMDSCSSTKRMLADSDNRFFDMVLGVCSGRRRLPISCLAALERRRTLASRRIAKSYRVWHGIVCLLPAGCWLSFTGMATPRYGVHRALWRRRRSGLCLAGGAVGELGT